MPASKIHCDFFETHGPDWSKFSEEQAKAVVHEIEVMDLLGKEPDRYGFVGTASLDTVIGGFLAVQYMAELLHYDTKKNQRKTKDTPFERLFFVLFARSGKLVLQNRKFVNVPLSMDTATRRIINALSEALQRSRIGYVTGLGSPSEKRIEAETFRAEFRNSSHVRHLSVEAPDPARVPEGFVYYNPQIERNKIIRESHQHDYPNFQTVDLEATSNGDLKETHFAKDLVESGTPTLMKYVSEGREQVLRRITPKKFEIYVDVDAEKLDKDTLRTLVAMLRTDIGLPVDIPVTTGEQPSLNFFGDSEDENEQE